MPLDGSPFLTFKTPEFNGFVPTTRGKYLTIRAKTDAPDRTLMALEGLQFLTI
jgi:hypothetical protein